MTTMRDDSKKPWASRGTLDHINSGSLQRIADAMERQAAALERFNGSMDETRRALRTLKATVSKLKRELKAK